ncbi:NAD(P)-binding protein [Devosia sp. SL43]|uniref:NAD(P)-binding protein n=1 Tax=Devosia sp. SL43 TaxID=2806348 RepID=UPI001F2D4DE0|nr:NAD(P)-binding protein [Devosia sp. SL43]UJW84426.1 NAD(P)-binding protein [Devosia sp. SL43]
MSLSERDRQLGMDRPITRRDFLNGVALATAGIAATALMPGAAHAQGSAYPPKIAGLRGHSETAMNIMHAVRDGTFWDSAPAVSDTGESYDLVVVGGGISGLSAARLYQRQAPGAKILILENNDDFGGHARRNEFVASNGKTILGYGGSQSLQTPTYFSPLVKDVLADIGVQVEKFEDYYDESWHEDRELGDAILFRKEDWGTASDTLVVTAETAAEWVPNTPLKDAAKANLIELIDAPPDYLPGKSREEKLELLSQTTYAAFLTEICGYDAELVKYFQHSTEAYFGMGIEGTTALDAWGNWNPGFDGMDLGDMPYKTMSPSGRLALTDPDPYIYHFPDGNAGVARSLVRTLIPDALPGSTMEDLVTTPVDYALLDVAGNDVRLRLNASVVRVKHDGDPANAESVTLTYLEGESLKTVKANQVVLACWHRIIPYLTDELGEAQITALQDQHKVPLIYTNVLLRNWEALDKAKIAGISDVTGFWGGAEIDFPVSMGDYKFADTPSDPIILHLSKIPLTGDPAMSAREQAQAGRYELTGISFEDMEREIRDMLDRALGSFGFDAATDIEAITCNRWSHGYALEYMRPWDSYWPDGPLPIETARQPWGRIAIANSDSGAYAYVHSAIDQAARAVHDLLGDKATLTDYSKFPGPPREMVGL